MRGRKIVLVTGSALALLALAVLAAFLWLRSSGLPQRGGEARIAGLGAPVTVGFDRWGVPHLEADSGRDAAAALGYLHANDRLTQMELGRRAAAGRLSEVVGEAAVELDRRALTLRLSSAAEALWTSASDEVQEGLEAYTSGVNAWLADRGSDLPPALRLLRLHPEPWEPVDSLSFALLMARDLSFWEGRPEEERFLWLQAFGPDGVRDLVGDEDLHIPEEILALAQAAARRRQTGGPGSGGEAAEAGAAGGAAEASPGSNNWALGGSWTASASPMVANDPHLPLRLPGTWYQVLIRAPGYEVAGMTLPGLPGVVVGRNGHLAWAVTNTMLDDHDLFFEELDASGERVRRGDGWAEVTVETVEIQVHGGDPVALELRSTDRGPLLPADPELGLPPRSLAWTAYLPADPLSAFLGLARAEDVESARAAIAGYVVPSQNLVLADDAGRLLYTMLGRTPARRRGDGRLPSPGWDAAYGWDGLRPREADPSLDAPAEDLLVTANHDIRPPGYLQPLPADFDTPHRAHRIHQLLTERRGWRLEELGAVQADVVSLYARQVVERSAGTYEGEAARAYEALAAWDGAMDTRGPAALFALFERALRQGLFADEARAHGLRPFHSRERLLRALSGEMDPAWFDDVGTPEVEDRPTVLAAALARAWREGAGRWGPDVATWPYGELHPLLLAHPLGRLPLIGRAFNRGPFPTAGSATTVAAFGGGWRGERRPVVYGPSMR